MSSQPFWETRTLNEMSPAEWESLCDGCGLCCLQKLEDEDDGELFYTRIACRLLDGETARCRNYDDRQKHVSDCINMRPLTDEKRAWLPESCAYRRIDEGRGLANWHPLVSGRAESVIEAGISVAGKTRAETDVPIHEWPDFVIDLDAFVASVQGGREP